MKRLLALPNAAISSLNYLATQRRRLGIWLVDPDYHTAAAVRSLSSDLQLRQVDLLVDLLSHLTDDADKPLGVFGPDDLAEWIRNLSYLPPSHPIIIHDIEPLLTTFGKPGTIGFFRLAAQLDPRWPVVLMAHLADLISAAGFPEDRAWRVSM